MGVKNISFMSTHLNWSNRPISMDRFAFFIITVAVASLVFLVLGFTVVSKPAATFVLSTGLAIVAIFGLIIYCVRRKPKKKGEDLMRFDLELSRNMDFKRNVGGRGRKKEVELPLFSFSSVSAATTNFSATNKLGEGGFGPVYKGVLLKGVEVAVKRLSGTSEQGFEEFKNEATIIAKVQHKNLVRLLGCCTERNERILIYEYMPNKSLDFFLFDQMKPTLDWETRVQIIEGIAQGLLYLHQFSRLQIIHRDLKASNILLDKEMNPKISDFGMARIMFGGNELQAKTKRIAGTYGYMSPEYAIGGVFSIKSDVFSFGVLLLEILSSKKSSGFYQTDSLNLLVYAWDLYTSDRVLDLIDPVLREETYSMYITSRYVNIALLCVQEIAEDRPTMSDVVSMLTNEDVTLPPPKPPAFSYLRSTVSSTTRPKNNSINEVTISLLEAR